MGLADTLGLTESGEQRLVRLLQFFLLVLAGFGLVTARVGMVVNGGASLLVTLLPALFRREYGYSMDAGLVLWITAAVCVHSVGMLGPYEWFGWYDAVAHTLSATVVAGVGYAALRAVEVDSAQIDVPGAFRIVFVVVFVAATGVIWEILEFGTGLLAVVTGGEPILAVRGIDDIVSDIAFNTVGAVVVALWGTDSVGGLVAFLRSRFAARDGES